MSGFYVLAGIVGTVCIVAGLVASALHPAVAGFVAGASFVLGVTLGLAAAHQGEGT